MITYKQILKIAKIKWQHIILLSILSIMLTTINIYLPLIMRNNLDNLNISLNLSDKIPLFFIFFLFILLQSSLSYFTSKVSNNSIRNLRNFLWSHILKQQMSFFDNTTSGSIVSRFINDTDVVVKFFISEVPTLFSKIMLIISSIIMILILDPKLWILLLIVLCIVALFLWGLGKISFYISHDSQTNLSKLTEYFLESVKNIRIIKVQCREIEESYIGKKSVERMYDLSMKESKMNSIIQPLFSIMFLLVVLFLFWYGASQIALGKITIGTFTAILIYIFQLCFPIFELAGAFIGINKAKGAAVELDRIINSPIEIGGSEDPKMLNTLEEQSSILSFNNVSFSYTETDTLLEDISFNISNGIVAMVGHSGSGKTTILNLISKLYSPNKGDIFFKGKNINNLSLTTWRKQIGYVFQNPILFNNSIRYNLLYGNENYKNITDQEIENILLEYKAFNFIFKKNKGLDYTVGENGDRLSGGQKQLLEIGRIILKNSAILILDEITSNLDYSAELEVQSVLKKLSNKIPILIVTHNLTSLNHTEKVLVLNNGRIESIGTHNELLNNSNFYADFILKHKSKLIQNEYSYCN